MKLLKRETRFFPEGEGFLVYELSEEADDRTDSGESYHLHITECCHGISEEILLDEFTDDRLTAFRIFHEFVEGSVTVVTAEDILWEIL